MIPRVSPNATAPDWIERVLTRTLSVALTAREGTILVVVEEPAAAAAELQLRGTGPVPTAGGDVTVDARIAEQIRERLEIKTSSTGDLASGAPTSLDPTTRRVLEIAAVLRPEDAEPLAYLEVGVPPTADIERIARQIGPLLSDERHVLLFGVSDLTEYGADFGFVPVGIGDAAEDWFIENDARAIDWITSLDSDRILVEARSQHALTNPRAVGLTTRISVHRDCWQGTLVDYAASHRESGEPLFRQSTGHAGVVF